MRTLQVIPQGSYVSEYLGELVTSEQAEERGKEYDRSNLSFLLDLDLDGKNFKYTSVLAPPPFCGFTCD